MTSLFTQMQQVWDSWPLAQRLMVLISTAASVAVFLGLVWWGSQPSFVVLMSNLSEADAAAVTERLDSSNVPFRLSAGGSTVLVPAAQRHELRIKLAGEGLPKGGGVGFEIFDTSDIGMSRFAEQLNYKRALEGELSRSIKRLNPVRDARVHLVLPKQSLFRNDKREAKAGVTVALEPGRKLSDGQVRSVVHLLVSSVEGLTEDQVTVVDAYGNSLARGGEGLGGASAALEFQAHVEAGIRRRALAMLERAVGANNAVVEVSAEVDLTQVDTTSETFDPDSVIVRSEVIKDEARGPGAATTGGVPGARSNLAGTKKGSSGPGQQEANRRSQTKNYEFNRETKREVRQPGTIRRLSVAVLVNGVPEAAAAGAAGADGAAAGGGGLRARNEEELQQLVALVQTAVGYDSERGDQVKVESMVFEAKQDVEGAAILQDPDWVTWTLRLWRPLLAGVLVLVGGLVLLLRRRRRRPQEIVLQQPQSVRELEATMAGRPAPAPILKPKRESYRPEPTQAANVLKIWLSEE